MEGQRGSQRSSFISAGQRNPDNVEDEEEYDSSDDDEMYLEPGEPFGAFLSPTPRPYDRSERVDKLNELLQNTQSPERRLPIRVRIREELNQYFADESDSDSNRGSGRHSRPLGEKQRASESQKRSLTGVQRPSSSFTNNNGNNNNKR